MGRISSRGVFGISAALLLTIAGCNSGGGADSPRDGGIPDMTVTLRCGIGDDPDGDFISSMDEGSTDLDMDGKSNDRDDDSDGDGYLDAQEAGDNNCQTPPRDTDNDGTPDFLDRDANGDGVDDAEQRDADLDMDGIKDALDSDIDGDNIPNVTEVGPNGQLIDTDNDGTPDVRDTDSDGDTILDIQEGAFDADHDEIPNFRDLDSDGDTIGDTIEAGDADTTTPPIACAAEIDQITLLVQSDGAADFVDSDSDNDGLSDGIEQRVGTNPCDVDSDDDSFSDLVEGAYVTINCPDGPGSEDGVDCDCATSATCSIPAQDYFLVLPFNGPAQDLPLDFGTEIRVADIFFITDTTGSMSGTVNNVKATVTTPGTGLIDRIRETIPDAWFGGGQHDDVPFSDWGSSPDQPFILAIGMRPPESSAAVQTAFNAIMMHGGSDGPESQTVALHQLMVGMGGTWTYRGTATYTMPNYNAMCLDGGWGAACFRDAALPIVVHFTDICSHNAPPGDTASCSPYTEVSPAMPTWAEMIAELNRHGAKYVGVNASSQACPALITPSGESPCYFMKRTAEETGSVDLDENPLVYNLPNTASSAVFADTIVNAIETIATRVPLDVDTALRDDSSDALGVDARRFIKRRVPACNATPAIEPCWTEPMGTPHEQAVAGYDQSMFFSVVPGTRVKFVITFRNDFFEGTEQTELFIAYIDVRAGGSAVLDTRQVYIVVPAKPVTLG